MSAKSKSRKNLSGVANIRFDPASGSVLVDVNPLIYPLDVIYSAAYVFTDRVWVVLDGDPKKKVVVSMRSKTGRSVESLGREFANELLHFALYKSRGKDNKAIRDAILIRVLQTNFVASNRKKVGKVRVKSGEAHNTP
ncbi:MAG: hypothetical protein V1921_08870 [Candidatus Altiarchaeota archaeon]